MEALIQAFKQYMLKNLDLQLEPKFWKNDKKIPFFLQDLYVFYVVTLLGKTCLLAVPKEIEIVTPAAIRKHLLQIREISGFPCIYLATAISSYNRQRLIKHGVQFVIPGRHIYLPALGIDWMERCSHCQKHRTIFNKQLSPSSQAVIIYAITNHKWEFIPLELAQTLNYTPMTMTRALNELESFDIGKTTRMGKERLIHFAHDSSKIWEQALPFLKSPVKKRLWLKVSKKGLNEIRARGVLAGLSALAETSMLSHPSYRIYAVGPQAWKRLQKSRHLQIFPHSEEADAEIEIWSYDPLLFAKDGRADCFSLYLSLKESGDERVEGALKKILKEAKW